MENLHRDDSIPLVSLELIMSSYFCNSVSVCVCVCVCCGSIFEDYFQQDRKHFCFKTIVDIMKP